MSRIRIIVRAFLVTVAAVVLLVPAAREEAAWCWAKFQDRAPNYMNYVNDWPKGRHVNQAREHFEQRQWAVTKREMIAQAYQQTSHTNTAPDADAAYQAERQLRRETLSWRQATNINTVAGFNEYLRLYPRGQFAAKAHWQIDTLSRSEQGAAPARNNPHP